ncbi:MAG TPA: hypothetical protein VLC95_20265, partial [Anaerolineae bacterium]|nr:hypothetical protein [Anaerolineae bacterium]
AYFGSPEIDTIKSNSLYNPGVGLASGAYYWRVQAGNFCGDGTWAAPWQFTIQAITENPSLLSPAAGEETCSNRPEFSWSAVPWATSYRLQVDELPSFSSPSIDIYTPGTTYLSTVDLPPSAYHWRVMATNACGPTEFTASQAFTITWEPVETPSRWNPALGDEVCEASLHFYWSAVDRATFYQLQVDDSSDFSSPEIDDVTSGQTYWPADPMPLGSYYWQVRARNACGDGPWPSSEKWFTTIAGPATPELLSPADGSSTCGTTPDLAWSPVTGAEYYWLQVDDDPAFGSPAINTNTPDPSYAPASPLASGTYFWRVYSYVHPCPSFWTPIRRFVIGSEPPPPPILVEPTPGGTVCSRTPLFDWTPGATAAAYQLQVDDDPGFPSPELDVVTTASDHVPTSALALGEQWVQVRAANACGDGPWSPAQSFAVATVPVPPLLSAPADGSRTPDMTPRFAWSPASGTASYHFQLAAESAFSSPLIDTTTPGAEYTPGRELAPGTYYWRVHTSNSCGTSAWAQAWTLTCLNASYVYLPLVVR